MKLNETQIHRYARQIILPQVGGRGQRTLLQGRVAVIGAGGLGSPVILYLAAAGVGTIDVIDDDRVDLTNLQRQVLHTTARVGVPKAESAKLAVAEINPDVTVHAHVARLGADNWRELLGNAQVVIDGSDNFATRYLSNDACHQLRRPLVSAAMFQFEGQAIVFPNDGSPTAPCYRCLFPEPPPPGSVPTCQEAGIFGALCGVMGSIQATEAIKLLLGIGDPLAGRLTLYDALTGTFRHVRVERNPECPLCGDHPRIHDVRAERIEERCETR